MRHSFPEFLLDSDLSFAPVLTLAELFVKYAAATCNGLAMMSPDYVPRLRRVE
jgi:hypothetical protein